MAESNVEVNVQNENNNMLQFSNIVGKLRSFNGKNNFKNFINQFNRRSRLENQDKI